jgi:hypothetical protein
MESKDGVTEAGQAMVITITIINSSSAQLVLVEGVLTAGVWDGPAPVPGRTLAAGSTIFVNDSQSGFGGAGGYISLAPAGGGSVTLSWDWESGSNLIAYGNVSGTSAISLSYSVSNVSSFHPTITYVITDPSDRSGCAGGRQ